MAFRRLEQHDRNQLELKLSYLLPDAHTKHQVVTEAFIFTPRTLGVSEYAYPAERFFEDTTAFIRLKTPDVLLAELGSVAQLLTWLEGDTDAQGAWRLRVLACVFRRSIRDTSRALAKQLESAEGETTETLNRALKRFHVELNNATGSLKEILVSSRHQEVSTLVDEFVSLVAESACTRLVGAIDLQKEGAEAWAERRDELAESAIAEYRHRRAKGYQSYATEGDRNEKLPYRRRILKRAVSSALYLDIGHERTGTIQQNIAGMIAASLAMFFAIVVAVWAQLNWPMTTWPFIAIMVVSYVVKDRIKELGRKALGRRVGRHAPDVLLKVRIPSSGAVVGVCKEWFSVQGPDDLEDEIIKIRYIDHPEEIAAMGRPESVMVHRKEVTIHPKGLQEGLGRVEGLTDIIRFNLARFRRRMDAPKEMYTLVHPETRELVEVPCGRVYHLNIVLRTTTGRGKDARVELERVRVVLNQKGIRRVERVYPSTALTDVEAVEFDDMSDSPELV